ncbi:hypothetical protein CHARACLAT_026236 [Characodon lateralis]|uniref:Uncharacterized protein n=1 Tax=Characodon lateralis TaxID=208331 RepID=A0ABU7E6X3_9TELE|nr:hypothetical protein [Characodon lateralis]
MFAALGEAQKGWAGPGWVGDVFLLPKVENIRKEKHQGEKRGSLGLFGRSSRCHGLTFEYPTFLHLPYSGLPQIGERQKSTSNQPKRSDGTDRHTREPSQSAAISLNRR